MKSWTTIKKIAFPLVLLLVSLCMAWFYRPWIYSNHINDWHIADWFPSFFSVLVPFFCYDSYCYLFNKPLKTKQAIGGFYLGYLIYETLQIPVGGFDWLDILAMSLTSLLLFIVVKLKEKTQ